MFDNEIEDGTDQGECSFTVHGLTGENLNTMSTNAIKAMTLRHLNNMGYLIKISFNVS